MKTINPNKAVPRLFAMTEELLRHPHFNREEFYTWVNTIAKVEFQSIFLNSGHFETLSKENLSLAKQLNGRYKFINPELIKEPVS